MKRLLGRCLAPTFLFLLCFCARPLEGLSQGTLEIRIKDHREAIGDFSQLLVSLDPIRISPKPGITFWRQRWTSLTPLIDSIDLTQYAGEKSVVIFRGKVDEGFYQAIHLQIKSLTGILKKTRRPAAVKHAIGPVKMSFAIVAGGATLIVLDLTVLDMSDHPPRGYELGLKGYELYTNGKLIDRIPPA